MTWTVITPNGGTFYINLKKELNYNAGIYEWMVYCNMDYTNIQGMVMSLVLYGLTIKKVVEELVYNVQDYASYDTNSNSIFISIPQPDHRIEDLNEEIVTA